MPPPPHPNANFQFCLCVILQLFKDAWLLHMNSDLWTWQPLKVANEDQGAPELWCHPACRVWNAISRLYMGWWRGLKTAVLFFFSPAMPPM